MNRRLEELGWSLVDLAEATEESYRNVHRWVRDDVKVPAHFVARFVRAVPVDSGWLVSGQGTPEHGEEGAAHRALEQVARIVDSVRLSSSEGVLTSSVVERSADGVFAVDRNLHCSHWNRSMESITGRDASFVIGKAVSDAFPALEGERIASCLRSALGGEDATLSSFAHERDGVQRWYEGHFHALRTPTGEVVGSAGILRDVTVVQRAEDLRCEAEERYAVLMEMTTRPSFLQAEGRVVEANGPLEELAGCTEPGELRGAAVDELLSSRSVRPTVSEALRAIAVGEWWGPAPALLRRRDASVLDVEVVAAGVRFRGDVATQTLLSTTVAAD